MNDAGKQVSQDSSAVKKPPTIKEQIVSLEALCAEVQELTMRHANRKIVYEWRLGSRVARAFGMSRDPATGGVVIDPALASAFGRPSWQGLVEAFKEKVSTLARPFDIFRQFPADVISQLCVNNRVSKRTIYSVEGLGEAIGLGNREVIFEALNLAFRGSTTLTRVVRKMKREKAKEEQERRIAERRNRERLEQQAKVAPPPPFQIPQPMPLQQGPKT